MSLLRRYAHWLHTQWPAGTVEKLPEVAEDGSTTIPGVYIVGDLTGLPLLKFAADSGARAVQKIAAQAPRGSGSSAELVIVGGGVAGMAAAIEARRLGLRFEVIEAAEPFFTIANFPAGKPIYTYPAEMAPAGGMQLRGQSKESLLEDLRAQMHSHGIVPRSGRAMRVARREGGVEVALADGQTIAARTVIIAIGRSGDFRRLNVPGEGLGHVYNRLHDPRDCAGRSVMVVGGGDSAVEAAIALAEAGAAVTLCHRGAELSRPKQQSIQRLNDLTDRGALRLMLSARVEEIRSDLVVVHDERGQQQQIAADAVFVMIGREAPLDFFRRSGLPIRGEWRWAAMVGLLLFLLLCVFVYHWKKGGTILPIHETFAARQWFPFNVPAWLDRWGELVSRRAHAPGHVLHTLRISAGEPGFYYSLAYCTIVLVFGLRRIRRRRTPYVRAQTWTLIAIQCLPLFVLPYVLLPWAGHAGWLSGGPIGWIVDQLFPVAAYGHGREYWRAFGLVLAWPLFIWNVFTDRPMWLWLAISVAQTAVIIPLMIRYWGKGAYCGWICSCGALAETLGDAHRHKMPHGPAYNRLNMAGQAVLAFAGVLLLLRVMGWTHIPGMAAAHTALLATIPLVNYAWSVDLMLAGVIGVGLYFHYSGRVWCRFFCPLAALMHIYARFSRFAILAEKSKCISCHVCTSVCHQGIDVMSFANKGNPMVDPQCVRCSACVQSCPTGVLQFGQIDRQSGQPLATDAPWLAASPVRMSELRVRGRPLSAVRSIALALMGMVALLGCARPAAAVDHSALDQLLRKHVREERIDYQAIRDADRPALSAYVDAMAAVDAAALPRDQQLAYYINLYNATVILGVADRLREGYSVSEKDFALFKEPLVRVREKRISLDDLEHKIIRPTFKEPRIHVARVCAAVSCPPILPRAYAAADLEQTLEQNMKRFITDRARNRIDPAERKLAMSQIFNWFAEDFGGKQNLAAYVARYAGVDTASFAVEFLPYDWSLNITRPSPAPRP